MIVVFHVKVATSYILAGKLDGRDFINNLVTLAITEVGLTYADLTSRIFTNGLEINSIDLIYRPASNLIVLLNIVMFEIAFNNGLIYDPTNDISEGILFYALGILEILLIPAAYTYYKIANLW